MYIKAVLLWLDLRGLSIVCVCNVKNSSDVQKRNIGVKLKNLFKNQFLLELSQKVKEVGSYLEI